MWMPEATQELVAYRWHEDTVKPLDNSIAQALEIPGKFFRFFQGSPAPRFSAAQFEFPVQHCDFAAPDSRSLRTERDVAVIPEGLAVP